MANTIAQLADQLRRGQTQASTLVDNAISAIAASNDQLNAFISQATPQTRQQAAQCDAAGYHLDTHPLAGIPIALKDVFLQQGTRTTCASRYLADFIAPYDATVVERLQAAGAIIVGKTNMDEFAMGSTTRHSYFGPCQHPFDSSLTPGGSSGGSAVAVAAGLVPVAIGTDTGGSVRQPAALCGVVGLKPTYGRISRYGMTAYASSLDQCGIFGLRAADCGTVLQAIAGHDRRDATSSDAPIDAYDATPCDLTGTTIGVAKECFGADLDDSLHQSIKRCLERFTKLGAQIREISIPHFPQAVASYYVTATAEASSNLGRYDGVRYGHRSPDSDDLQQLYTHSRSEGFGGEVQRRIMLGVFVLSSGYFDAYYNKAQKIRRLLAEDFARAFQKVDSILAPVTPAPHLAANLGQDNPTREYLADLYTVPANLAGLPAIAFPCEHVANPKQAYGFAAQLMGPHWSEKRLLNLVASYEDALNLGY